MNSPSAQNGETVDVFFPKNILSNFTLTWKTSQKIRSRHISCIPQKGSTLQQKVYKNQIMIKFSIINHNSNTYYKRLKLYCNQNLDLNESHEYNHHNMGHVIDILKQMKWKLSTPCFKIFSLTNIIWCPRHF